MWKGVEPKSVGHAGLEHLLEDDSCGFEKFLKNETPVVDNGPCCQKCFFCLRRMYAVGQWCVGEHPQLYLCNQGWLASC